MSTETPQPVVVKLDWSDATAGDAQHVNQVLGQVGPPSGTGVPDGIYVSLGSVAPPIIPIEEEERRRAIEALLSFPVRVSVHGRIHMSREVLDDVIRVLQATAAQYDAAVEAADGFKISSAKVK
jgi:hypothetical protein